MTIRSDRWKLVVAVVIMATIWLVLLPQVSQWGPIRNMIQSHQAAGIDPSAMFYTELEHHDYHDGMLRRKP